jgi:hypothetical protein
LAGGRRIVARHKPLIPSSLVVVVIPGTALASKTIGSDQGVELPLRTALIDQRGVVAMGQQQFYYDVDGKVGGPVSAARLKQAAASKHLKPTDRIRQEGTEKWILAKLVKGLFPEASAASPPVLAKRPPPPPPTQTAPPAPASVLDRTVMGGNQEALVEKDDGSRQENRVYYLCPTCSIPLQSPRSTAGAKGICPACDVAFAVPLRILINRAEGPQQIGMTDGTCPNCDIPVRFPEKQLAPNGICGPDG